MPSMLDHESNSVVKLLNASDSGGGKTGALACLIDAGYNIRVLDFDNGLGVLKGYVKDKSKLANVHYVELSDKLKLVNARFNIVGAKAFDTAMKALETGGDIWGAGSNIGPITDWGPRDILVVDTLSTLARSCLLNVMQVNGAIAKNPEIQHYGVAMENCERLLTQLTAPTVRCNIIVNTHLKPNEETGKIYPEAIGSKLGPRIARYFDNFVSTSLKAGKRTIKTEKDGILMLKTSVKCEPEYDISDGYLKLFAKLLGTTVDKLPPSKA